MCRERSGQQQVREPGQREQQEFGRAQVPVSKEQLYLRMQLVSLATMVLAGTNVVGVTQTLDTMHTMKPFSSIL